MTIKRSEIWAAIEPMVLKVVQKYRASELPIFGAPNTYSVSWTGATTNPSLGNGTLIGRYSLVGKLVKLDINLQMGSTTSYGSGAWSFSLPFTAINPCVNMGLASAYDNSSGMRYPLAVLVTNGATALSVFVPTTTGSTVSTLTSAIPFTWATNDLLRISLWYERE